MENMIIVGGGTAGWMAASYFAENRPDINITLIDKEVGTPIGVGEATVLDFKPFMDKCSIPQTEWMSFADATFKSGIMFPGWKHKDNTVWHPFLAKVMFDQYTQWDLWAMTQTDNFTESVLGMYDVSLHNKVDLQDLDCYAYHVDCSKLVQLMKRRLENRITFISSDVENVVKENTNITKLVLSNGQEVSGDLYIDCTGFKSILKTQDKVSLDDRLFCNTAIAGHVEYQDKGKEMRPYVISEAVDHGWIWNIPVQSRIGTGLVFNRDITDIETAKEYFVTHWNNRINKDNLKVINWDPYYINNMWEGNVVSIGLSAGFIEPLESTGLALMRLGIEKIHDQIHHTLNVDEHSRNIFNSSMLKIYNENVDFVNMHYADTERTEPFWNYVKSKHRKSSMQLLLEEKLRTPDERITIFTNNEAPGVQFHSSNWVLWLIQMNYPVNQHLDMPQEYAQDMIERFKILEQVRTLRSIDHDNAVTISKIPGGLR